MEYSNFKALTPILDEFSEWYGDLLRYLFYSDIQKNESLDKSRPSFEGWLKSVENSALIEAEAVKKLQILERDLYVLAANLCDAAHGGSIKPSIKDYDQLSNLYYALLNNLRRVEFDAFLEDSGIDALTGLRSKHTMNADIEREIERLARRGKPFCLALAQIDHYEDIAAEHGRTYAREITKTIAGLIKQSMRSFDDGYRLGSGEFILCLKQADVTGGVAALERLRKMLEAKDVRYTLGGRERYLSMSCCIAAPFPGDDVDTLIENLRKDLVTTEKPANSLLEYHEMSDLQRYIQEKD